MTIRGTATQRDTVLVHTPRNHDRGSSGESGLPERTSETLIARAKAHDSDAWRRLVDLYSPLVYFWCRRSGLSAEDSADVLQEVFQGVFAGIARLRHDRHGDTFRGWLRAITTHKIQDHFRREGHRPKAAGGTDSQVGLMALAGDELESSVVAAPWANVVHRAAELVRLEFEDRTWQAFWLTAVEGLAAVDVGDRLAMSASAVRQAKCRVLHRLRGELRDCK